LRLIVKSRWDSFTHEHADHTSGIDDIRPFILKRRDPIYAHDRVINNLKERFNYIFTTVNRYPGAPSVKTIANDDEPFQIGNKVAIPNVMHGNLQVFGYRVDDFAYLTDVKTIDESEILKLKNLKVLVVNTLREESLSRI
jgi:phosphoribosyl 1,2-cyclic phosphate phosphodiesterase